MTPRTDKIEQYARKLDGNDYWPGKMSGHARQLKNELNASQSAIMAAIKNILEHGGNEEWPIIKQLRAAVLPVIETNNKDWWCETCQQFVPSNMVTFYEYHDARYGGCGFKVQPTKLAHIEPANK